MPTIQFSAIWLAKLTDQTWAFTFLSKLQAGLRCCSLHHPRLDWQGEPDFTIAELQASAFGVVLDFTSDGLGALFLTLHKNDIANRGGGSWRTRGATFTLLTLSKLKHSVEGSPRHFGRQSLRSTSRAISEWRSTLYHRGASKNTSLQVIIPPYLSKLLGPSSFLFLVPGYTW